MKCGKLMKALIVVTAILSLTGILICGAGCLILEERELFTKEPTALVREDIQRHMEYLADTLLGRYCAKMLGNCPDELTDWFNTDADPAAYGVDADDWWYCLRQYGQQVYAPMGAEPPEADPETEMQYEFSPSLQYPVLIARYDTPEAEYFVWEDDTALVQIGDRFYAYRMAECENYTVELRLIGVRDDAMSGISVRFLELLRTCRWGIVWGLILSVVLGILSIVFLCLCMGRTAGGEKRVGGLNRLPLDLYAALAAVGGVLLLAMAVNLVRELVAGYLWEWFWVTIPILLAAVSALAVALLSALSAQLRQGWKYVWQHSAVGWCLCRLWRIGKKLFTMLPVMWQWLLTALIMVALLLIGLALSSAVGSAVPFAVAGLLCIGIVIWGAFAFGKILKATREMASGNLNAGVSRDYLFGAFEECARNLGSVADVAVLAARSQMKAERMRAELVTNVSHDIKTPLTSIINYVDLLQKTDDPQEQAQYLDVLGRQSQRMKKLIEDLVEMSKAATGNVTVNPAELNAVEAVNQALGEFADKLAGENLKPVFCPAAESIPVIADGRLTWRVLSNLLSNVVKYAMPGTRVYLDVTRCGENVLISIKNISREPLNVSADELTERFVRGDASRNTEGSGLGLNIAMSLMQLQKGDLRLLVDGDLFKATLIFPAK